ncbi:MAG: acetyl-CoA synthetase [Methanobacteriota archaeon]|nr:MAG: acetyl-CoA synthetase [Euryarchaeota archaeon]
MGIPVFNAPEKYYSLWRASIEDRDKFWDGIARESMVDIHWFKEWEKVFEREYPHFKWFVGGVTNTGYNCVDYKVARYGEKTAYIHEAPELGVSRRITYEELYKLVRKYSAALRGLGVDKGDRVLCYMPNSIEAVAILLSCARIGAISTCVFAGFSSGALADRIELTTPKTIFTQDSAFRRGKEVKLKEIVDEALRICPTRVAEKVEHVVVNRVTDRETPETGKEKSFEEFEEMGKGLDDSYVPLESNEPLFIMCTSGTTAKPKPVVHTHGGFQIWAYWTAKWIYNLKPGDVVFNTSDIGWIVGQSYLVFGPPLAGCTAVLYEGTPDYPEPDMWWRMIEKHRATLLWISPTGARALRALGVEQAEKHDLGSVERVVCAGEVLNPEVWHWLHEDVFKGRIPVIDHMWQTEVPGAMFGYPLGVEPPRVKPGSAGFPLPGVLPEIVDERDGRVCKPNERGILLLREPVPGMTANLWGDPERYRREYWEAKPITSGRYYTGDSAYLDDEGYIWFSGRSDEVIKIAAHRVGPTEVESALISHHAVAEAGVCGVPDEFRGELVAAFVVLRSGVKPSEELKKELVAHVRKVMGPFIVFKGIEFVDMLPKTRSGKIMRRVMRRLWTGEELGDLSTIETDASVDEVREAISKLRPVEEAETRK